MTRPKRIQVLAAAVVTLVGCTGPFAEPVPEERAFVTNSGSDTVWIVIGTIRPDVDLERPALGDVDEIKPGATRRLCGTATTTDEILVTAANPVVMDDPFRAFVREEDVGARLTADQFCASDWAWNGEKLVER